MMTNLRLKDWVSRPAGYVADVARDPDRLARALGRIRPYLSIALIAAIVSPHLAFAQGPGGTIFGSDDQTVGNGIKAAAKYARVALFFLGLFFFMWAAKNYGSEKPWGKQVGGGVGCWAFAGFSALFYSWSQGTEVTFDSDLGS